MNHQFTQTDFARLMGVASDVADRFRCSASEAVSHISRTVAVGDKLAVKRVGKYADAYRRLRAQRNRLLGADLTRDPAWDLLLDLTAAHDAGTELCTTTLCAGAGVPYTTALRHLDRLERHGFIQRGSTSIDQRYTLVQLAPERVEQVLGVVARFRDMA